MEWLLLFAVQQSLVLAVWRWAVPGSRRTLAVALVMVVPVAGPLLALLVLRTRGAGVARKADLDEPDRNVSAAAVRRAGELPPLLDRLMSSHTEDRLSALARISASLDPSSVGLLRWAMDHGTPDVVLDAALAIEELDLRRDKRLDEARQALASHPSFERALAAAEEAARGVVTGLVDEATAGALAEQARVFYREAFGLAPTRWLEIEEHLARLELAAGRPAAALEILNHLTGTIAGEAGSRLRALRDDAAFAARRFELMGAAPVATPASDDPAAWNEATIVNQVAHELYDVRRPAGDASWGSVQEHYSHRPGQPTSGLYRAFRRPAETTPQPRRRVARTGISQR